MNESHIIKVWLTINEAAKEASVSRRTIYNWIQKNKLCIKRTISGSIRINVESLWKIQ